MVERVRVTVRASDAHQGVLTIQDAKRQVLDLFNLLEGGDTEPSGLLTWHLCHASTNSPFTAVGEAISLLPDVDVAVIARAQKTRLKTDLDSIQVGSAEEAIGRSRVDTVKSVMSRNTNGIGITEIDFLSDLKPVLITEAYARNSLRVIEDAFEKQRPYELGIGKFRREIGSVEGIFLDVGLHYNKPAIRIIERRTKSAVWCLIDDDIRQTIAEKSNYNDVWERRRVKIKGKIDYDPLGRITRIYANNIERINPRRMTLDDIHDPEFTQGISIEEYMALLREGELAGQA